MSATTLKNSSRLLSPGTLSCQAAATYSLCWSEKDILPRRRCAPIKQPVYCVVTNLSDHNFHIHC